MRSINYFAQDSTVCAQSVGGRWAFDEVNQRWSYRGATCLKYLNLKSRPVLSSITDSEGSQSSYQFSYNEASKESSIAIVDGANTLNTRRYNKDGEIVDTGINGQTTRRVNIAKSKRRRSSVDENGNTTTTEYDEWLNITKITYPDGSHVSRKWEPTFSSLLEEIDENGVITRYDYDAKGNRIRTTEAVGLPEQRVIEYSYDAYGNTTQIRFIADANTAEAVISMTYDAYGNLKTYTDGEGHTTEYLSHDALGNALQKKDARGQTWSRQYDATGNLTHHTTALGHITTLAYDKVGNLKTLTKPGNAVTTMDYDGRNRLIQTTNPLGASIALAYNGGNRPIRVTDALGNSVYLQYTPEGKPASITDAMGNTVSMSYGDAEGKLQNLLTAIHFPTYTQTLHYDNRYRVIQSDDETEGSPIRTSRSDYDKAGNRITVTDALSRVTHNTYDGLQRITRMTDAAQALTQLQYDSRDNLIAVTNAKDVAIRQYQYDGNNRQTAETLPSGAAFTNQYDVNGNLSGSIDAKGQVIHYIYDDDDRLIETRYFSTEASAEDPANAQKLVTFSYDHRDNLTGYDDGQTSATYQYDLADRMTQVTVNYGAFTLSYAYTYDANNRKQSFTDPDGITYTYSYTANGELASVNIPGEGTYTVNGYQWSQPTQATLPGGGKRQWTYDGFLRPTQITGLDPGQNAVQQDSYTYNAVDNILGRNTLNDSYQYGYDAVDRLLAVTSNQAENVGYTYDPVGNRQTDSTDLNTENDPHTWVYDDNDRLIQRGPITYTYDANGSLINKTNNETNDETRYTYNIENRLSEIRDQNDVLIARYSYDPFGRRLSKTTNTTTYYLFAQEGLVAEADTMGSITTSYLYKTDSTWGTDPLLINQNGQVGYYHNDHLGTPQKITARSGAVLWSATYNAFGKAAITTNTIENNLRLPGQYYDEETGTHYNYFRDYDPEKGRYIQSDPIGLRGGVNTFAYVLGNPLTYADPLGLLQVDSTYEAYNHYWSGDGRSVELGPKTKEAIKNSTEQRYRSERIRSGLSPSLDGNYGVNVESEVYHVGDTPIYYSTLCNGGICTTTYTNKDDGFWDPIYDSDRKGPGGGEFGTPFDYEPWSWSETYSNPYLDCPNR
nr:RHS repeat domain-containing protein [Spongiibacter thalassae]